MKMPWNKKAKPLPVKRGSYKTAGMRAKEQTDKADMILAKAFTKYLNEHPEIAERIALQKFSAKLPKDDDEPSSYAPPDMLQTLRDASEIKEFLKDEIAGSAPEGGLMGLLKSVLASDKNGVVANAIGEFLGGLSSTIRGRPVQPEAQPVMIQPHTPPMIQPPTASVQPASGVSVTDAKTGVQLASLVPLLSASPIDCIDTLADLSPKWVRWLAKQDYASVTKLAKRVTVPADMKEKVDELLTEPRRDWIENVLAAARDWAEVNGE